MPPPGGAVPRPGLAGRGAGTPVLAVHATGFCKELWGPVADLLQPAPGAGRRPAGPRGLVDAAAALRLVGPGTGPAGGGGRLSPGAPGRPGALLGGRRPGAGRAAPAGHLRFPGARRADHLRLPADPGGGLPHDPAAALRRRRSFASAGGGGGVVPRPGGLRRLDRGGPHASTPPMALRPEPERLGAEVRPGDRGRVLPGGHGPRRLGPAPRGRLPGGAGGRGAAPTATRRRSWRRCGSASPTPAWRWSPEPATSSPWSGPRRWRLWWRPCWAGRRARAAGNIGGPC